MEMPEATEAGWKGRIILKVTISEIAAAADTSISTVSRVLTGSAHVDEETRRRVEAAVQASGYKYKPSKKHKKQTGGSVMLVCGDLSSHVYTSYIRGISSVLEPAGFSVFTVDTGYDSAKEENYVSYAVEENFIGVIMLSAIGTERLVSLTETVRLPILFVNRYLRAVDTDIVCSDNYRGGYIATKYLIDKGHTHIAHLAGPQNSTSCSDRMHGYQDCMRDNELPVEDGFICFGDLQADSGRDFARKLAAENPGITAVYSANDVMAAAMVNTLLEMGKNVPANLSVICSDNAPENSNSRVRLTSVGYDDFRIGEAAGRLLLERLSNPASPRKKVVYCPILTEADSVAEAK